MPDQDDELEPILKTLRSKAEQYEVELRELQCKVASVAMKLDQIQTAVSALQGGPASKPITSKARSNKRATPTSAQIGWFLDRVTKEKG